MTDIKLRDQNYACFHEARRQSLLDAVKNKEIRTLIVEASSQCNLRCTFCDMHSGRNGDLAKYKGIMTMTMFEKIVSDIQKAGFRLKMLQYIGHGEPLMNKALGQFIRLAKDSGICDCQKIITNGTLLTREKLADLVDCGLDIVEVSLDAADRERYIAIKGQDLYDKVYRNLCDAIDYAAQTDKFDLVIKTALPHPDHAYGVEQGDAEKVKDVFGIKIQDTKRVLIRGVPVVTFSDAVKQKANEYRQTCEIPFYMMMVLFDGEVTACCSDALRYLRIGDLKKQSLADVIQGDKLRQLRQCHLDHQQDKYPFCLYCSNRPATDVEPVVDELKKWI